MLIDFECLTIEITRRCGMKCAHCMRGDAQDVLMDYNAILNESDLTVQSFKAKAA